MKTSINVPSFSVNHETLLAGLYLRETRRLGIFSGYKVWDLRFYAPSDKHYMTAGTMHTIEHLLAYKLREYLGKKYIQTFPYGCTTGFGLITTINADYAEVRKALLCTIQDIVPLCDKYEVPALTSLECGRPTLFNLKGANTALYDYELVLECENYL